MNCKAERYQDKYYAKDAHQARAATVNVKTMIAEFGDPNGGLGYVDPYESTLPTSSVIYEKPVVNTNRVSTFPTFMPDVVRIVARNNRSSAQQ